MAKEQGGEKMFDSKNCDNLSIAKKHLREGYCKTKQKFNSGPRLFDSSRDFLIFLLRKIKQNLERGWGIGTSLLFLL